jgi:hypothetical protein
MMASFYWDNFIYFGSGPKKGPDGKLYLTFPLDDKKMAGIAAEDIGKCAYGIFKRGEELISKTVGVCRGTSYRAGNGCSPFKSVGARGFI